MSLSLLLIAEQMWMLEKSFETFLSECKNTEGDIYAGFGAELCARGEELQLCELVSDVSPTVHARIAAREQIIAASKLEKQAPFCDWGIPEVICNGDLWSNNILMKKHPITGEPTDELAAILDWQVRANCACSTPGRRAVH